MQVTRIGTIGMILLAAITLHSETKHPIAAANKNEAEIKALYDRWAKRFRGARHRWDHVRLCSRR